MTAITAKDYQGRLDEMTTEAINNFIGQMRDVQGQIRFISDLTSLALDAQKKAQVSSPETLHRLTQAIISFMRPEDIRWIKATQKIEFKEEKDKLIFLEQDLRKEVTFGEAMIKAFDTKLRGLRGTFKNSVDLTRFKQERELEVQCIKDKLRLIAGCFTVLKDNDWQNLKNNLQKKNKPFSETFVSLVKN
jgi:hypothetical protein